LARVDVEQATDYYADEAGVDVALAFIAAIEQAYSFIAEVPGSGSPHWAHELDLPGLRAWPIKGFPWIVFYSANEIQIDVWRVLHAKRDIPASMRDDDHN